MQKLMQKHRKFLKGDAGFSLVELIIVIAIMAALIAILAPQYMKYVDKSRKTADSSTADEIFTACKTTATDELITSNFSVTWDGATLTYTGDSDADDLIQSALGLSGTALVAKFKGTISTSYTVTYTAATPSIAVTSAGWW